MSLSRFLTRNFPDFAFNCVGGVVGARRQVQMSWVRQRPTIYRGKFDRHTLILVNDGHVGFGRQEVEEMAGPGDALLIGPIEAGCLAFLPSEKFLSFETMTFDTRSIARVLRHQPYLECRAIDENDCPAALAFPGFQRAFKSTRGAIPTSASRFKGAITELLLHGRPGFAGYWRKHFYESRWMLCAHLESFVTNPERIEAAACHYPDGVAGLRRDSLLYAGVMPHAALSRRRIQLATAWLRCGHSIEDVAKSLGYASRWEFECEYAGIAKRRCCDIQKEKPLTQAAPEELIRLMQPFWWSNAHGLSIERPQPDRLFDDDLMSIEEERATIGASLKFQSDLDEQLAQRSRVTEELQERAVEFFAMKSTGAEKIIPIFNCLPPQKMAA